MRQEAFDFIRDEKQLGFGFCSERVENIDAETWQERLREDREENERTYRRY